MLTSKLPENPDQWIKIQALKEQIRKINLELVQLIVRLNDLQRDIENE